MRYMENKIMEYIADLSFVEGDGGVSVCRDESKILRVWLELSRALKDNIGIEDLGGDHDVITPLIMHMKPEDPLDLMFFIYSSHPTDGGYMVICLEDFMGKNLYPLMENFCSEEAMPGIARCIFLQLSSLKDEGVVHEDARLTIDNEIIQFEFISMIES